MAHNGHEQSRADTHHRRSTLKIIAPTLAAVVLSASVAGAADFAHAGDRTVAVTRNIPAELLLSPADRLGLNGDTVQVTIGHTALVPAADLLSASDLERSGLSAGASVPATTFSGAGIADEQFRTYR